MNADRFEDLLRVWQDGEATADELRELEAALRSDPRLRRELVGSVLLEAGLYGRYAAAAAQAGPRFSRRRLLDAAAALLVVGVSALALGLLLRGDDEPRYRVVSGKVSTRDDGAFEVGADGPAVIVLKRGTRLDLAPASVGRAGESDFELLEGGARFDGSIRVQTPGGSVVAGGGSFSIRLRPLETLIERPELTVSVESESVRVDAWGLRTTLLAGESRVFGPTRTALELAKLLEGATLTLPEILERARAVASGVAISASLEDENGKASYSVEFAVDRRVRELGLDPKTGAVVDDETDDSDESRLAAEIGFPLQEAILAALRAVPGRAVSAEFEREKGRTLAEVKILADGVLHEVKLDARTGERVLKK